MSATTSEPAAAPNADAAPGGGAASEEVHCPLCDYNLRGLAEPRCPECGYAFQWADLRDPAKRLHPYLFEHHPERNIGSFLRTFFEGLRPRRFWTSLHPAQASRPRRLIAYWLVMTMPMVLAVAAWNAGQTAKYRGNIAVTRARVRAGLLTRRDTPEVQALERTFGSIDGYVDAGFPRNPPARFYFDPGWDGSGALNDVAVAVLAWPWLTFVTLLLFRFSMRRARIRPAHVLRCVLYSFDAVLWAGVVAAAMVAPTVLNPYARIPRGGPNLADLLDRLLEPYLQDPVTRAVLLAAALLLPFMAWRLTVAYRQYLRFDRPAATVLASQVIVLLALIVAAVRVQLTG
jgi:hypothetical protein